MFDRAVEAVIIILGAAFEERVPAAVIERLPWLEAYAVWVKIAYWAGLVFLFWLATWFTRGGCRSVGFLRRQLFERAKFEGVWLQDVTNERPYSVSVIEYVPSEGKWRYRGAAFDRQFQFRAEWETNEIFYNEHRRTWHFAGNGKLFEEDKGVPREVNAFDIAVVLTLRTKRDLGIHGKAADFNFREKTDGDEERVFSIEARRADQPVVIVERARNMTPTERWELFQP